MLSANAFGIVRRTVYFSVKWDILNPLTPYVIFVYKGILGFVRMFSISSRT